MNQHQRITQVHYVDINKPEDCPSPLLSFGLRKATLQIAILNHCRIQPILYKDISRHHYVSIIVQYINELYISCRRSNIN